MTAWHKALKNVVTWDKTIAYEMPCSNQLASCHTSYFREDFFSPCGINKLKFVREAKDEGWTYTPSGDWLCPECSEKGAK